MSQLQKYMDMLARNPLGKPIKLETERENYISMLRWADETYAAGEPIMLDSAYDKAREDAQARWPEDPYFQEVGAPNIAYKKVEHEIYLGSLKKMRPAAALSFLKKHSDVTWGAFVKLDGISLSLRYRDGKLVQALTRGTGKVGQDVTAWAERIGHIPKTIQSKAELIVMGEAIISRPAFEKLKKDYASAISEGGKSKRQYVNARNAVAGAFRRMDFDKPHLLLLAQINFMAWRVWAKKDGEWHMLKEEARDSLKFPFRAADVLHRHLGDDATEELLVNLVQTVTDPSFAYGCDGVVVFPMTTKEKAAFGPLNTTLPDWGIAIKLDPEQQRSQEGTIKEVVWEQSIRGIYNPVCVLEEPVTFDGVQVQRISLHNLGYVAQYEAGPGSTVQVIRSGDVIPRVISCTPAEEVPIPETCVNCEAPLEKDEKGVHLYCTNLRCEGVERERFLRFIECLGIDGISRESGLVLWDEQSIEGVTELVEASLSGHDHIFDTLGESRKEKLVAGVKAWRPTEAELAYASGFFVSRHVSLGVSRLETLFSEGLEAEGIGTSIRTAFKHTLPRYKEWLAHFPIQPVVAEKAQGPLEGKSFAFTGFRDKELEKHIKDNGGKVESVKKTTTILFGQPGSTKAAKAEKYGIPIVDPADARKTIEDMTGKAI